MLLCDALTLLTPASIHVCWMSFKTLLVHSAPLPARLGWNSSLRGFRSSSRLMGNTRPPLPDTIIHIKNCLKTEWLLMSWPHLLNSSKVIFHSRYSTSEHHLIFFIEKDARALIRHPSNRLLFVDQQNRRFRPTDVYSIYLDLQVKSTPCLGKSFLYMP